LSPEKKKPRKLKAAFVSQDNYPEKTKLKNGDYFPEQEKAPKTGRSDLTPPEYSRIDRRVLNFMIVTLEVPLFVSVVINSGPPSQTDKQSSSDVLYSPEVNAQQNSDEQEDNYVVEDHPEE